MAGNVAAREIPLSKRGHRLVFDRCDGLYRLAYYFPKLDPRSHKQTGEERIACKHRDLFHALQVIFGEATNAGAHSTVEGKVDSPFDPLTVEHYIRSTAWGRELP